MKTMQNKFVRRSVFALILPFITPLILYEPMIAIYKCTIQQTKFAWISYKKTIKDTWKSNNEV